MLPRYISIIIFSLLTLSLLFFLPAYSHGQETNEQKLQRLSNQLNSNDENEQIKAAEELGKLGNDAIPILASRLRTGRNEGVLYRISEVFGVIGKDAVPELTAVLEQELSENKNSLILRYTANSLKNIAARAENAPSNLKPDFRNTIPILKKILENKKDLEMSGALNKELEDFDAAADCLDYIGKDAGDAVPLLIELSKNEKYRKEPHYRKKDAVTRIIGQLKSHSDFSANAAIRKSFETYKNEIMEGDRREIEVAINELETAEWLVKIRRLLFLKEVFTNYPVLSWSVVVISSIFLSWFFIFLIRPLWLLKLYEIFPISETRLSGVLGVVTVPLHYLPALFIFRPRVLNAWVRKYLKKAYGNFSSKKTVEYRRVYVPVGLFLDDKLISEFTPKNLQETFTRNQSRLLISGVGGAGKTSLACQIAKWAMSRKKDKRLCPGHSMLPVLLEQDFSGGGEEALKKAIAAQLSDLIDSDKPISNALLQALLEKKRVLVLIDGMSEMNEATRNAILSGVTGIPTNAIIFTSRTDESIDGLSKTVIKPTPIKGKKLSSFVENYLMSLGKKELFEDEEFFEGCRLLSKIVNDREITALFARLFVELMVARQEKTIDEDLPKDIPNLMLLSIKRLHPEHDLKKLHSDAPPLWNVIESAKVIAWECLKKDYRPLPADYEKVKKALANLPNGEDSLNYLKDRLKLIEATFWGKKIRFNVDPLAEYLAAMYLVEENKYSEEKWNKFFDSISSKPGYPESIKGFLLAVRDCCMVDEVKDDIPTFVMEKLIKITEMTGK